jgi:hypothetical protein
MTRNRVSGPRASFYATVTVLLVALGGLGVLGAHELALESAQARSLVALGRTELQKGETAGAVVSFKRAELLAPRADFVRSALTAAKGRGVESPVVRVVNWLAPREWSFLLVAFGWMAGLSLAIAIGRGPTDRLARRLALTAGLLFALTAVGVVQSSSTTQAVAVVSNATGMLIAPYQGAGATADLAPGVVVALGARYGDFVQVSGPDGAHGWVIASALEPVIGG